MRRFYLFRTNLKNLESYHKFTVLEEFKKECWDFYLNQGISFLENDYFDEVVIFRLADVPYLTITFDINGKKFIQKWVRNFNEVFCLPPADVSFFRGGFDEYDDIIKKNPSFFGLKLYYGAGKRVYPKFTGLYDKVLIESLNDYTDLAIPFYKTASGEIFKPLNLEKKYDIFWYFLYTFEDRKGQEFFIKEVSKSDYLKSLKIIHCGNNDDSIKNMCLYYGVNNIEFLGFQTREKINEILNHSKFGLVTSDRNDGSPRSITEILMSETPLFLRSTSKLLPFYKDNGIIQFDENDIQEKIYLGLHGCFKKPDSKKISIEKICKMNIDLWK